MHGCGPSLSEQFLSQTLPQGFNISLSEQFKCRQLLGSTHSPFSLTYPSLHTHVYNFNLNFRLNVWKSIFFTTYPPSAPVLLLQSIRIYESAHQTMHNKWHCVLNLLKNSKNRFSNNCECENNYRSIVTAEWWRTCDQWFNSHAHCFASGHVAHQWI
jgi:hypothetical protein